MCRLCVENGAKYESILTIFPFFLGKRTQNLYRNLYQIKCPCYIKYYFYKGYFEYSTGTRRCRKVQFLGVFNKNYELLHYTSIEIVEFHLSHAWFVCNGKQSCATTGKTGGNSPLVGWNPGHGLPLCSTKHPSPLKPSLICSGCY